MSITEKKRLSCFYHYGGERKVLLNGTFQYVGGVSGAMLIEDGVSEPELLSEISSCLNVELEDNMFIFHNTKRDKTKYVCVRGDNGVKMLFYLNEDEVDVFIEEDPIHAIASTRVTNFVESNETPRGKKLLNCFCYRGGKRMLLPDGTFKYDGGVSEAMLIEDDVSYVGLNSKIRSCLCMDWSPNLYYNTKRDKTKYLRLKDQDGVKMLFRLNEEEVDVFAV